MAAELTVRVEGVKDTIRLLGKLDPELRKAFRKDATKIVKPILDDAKSEYIELPLSGLSRTWAPPGRKPITPTTPGRMRQGVQFSVRTGNRERAVFSVKQKNAAASIIDMAGKRNPDNRLSRSLTTAGYGRPSRIMWPAAEKNGDRVRDELLQLVEEVGRELSKKLGD